MSKVEVSAGSRWIVLGAVWALDLFKFLPHGVNGVVHVQHAAFRHVVRVVISVFWHSSYSNHRLILTEDMTKIRIYE